jgi:hypothetical protein
MKTSEPLFEIGGHQFEIGGHQLEIGEQ